LAIKLQRSCAMKNSIYVAILALALSFTGVSAQQKGKAKSNEKPRPAVERSTPKDQQVAACSPDTTGPVIHSVTPSPSVLWAPNHKMMPVSVSANVTDNCSAVTWSVTAISSDEPANGTGDGDTAPDSSITGAHGVNLRAERAGSGDGRIYTITIVARDVAGNRTTGTTTVSVPHSQKK
jgi:hypothetical protein